MLASRCFCQLQPDLFCAQVLLPPLRSDMASIPPPPDTDLLTSADPGILSTVRCIQLCQSNRSTAP